jgi:hypothetical protein
VIPCRGMPVGSKRWPLLLPRSPDRFGGGGRSCESPRSLVPAIASLAVTARALSHNDILATRMLQGMPAVNPQHENQN